jgi:hypothetical protein
VQFSNTYLSPQDKTYPFSYTTAIRPGQILALPIKPEPKSELAKTAQLITIQWVRDGKASGGR